MLNLRNDKAACALCHYLSVNNCKFKGRMIKILGYEMTIQYASYKSVFPQWRIMKKMSNDFSNQATLHCHLEGKNCGVSL